MLHWNVQWGGGLWYRGAPGRAQRRAIVDREPDLVVLSEAPPRDWLDRLLDRSRPGRLVRRASSMTREPRTGTASPSARDGRSASRSIFGCPEDRRWASSPTVRGRPLRLLVVDGISTPTRSRIPFLRAIADDLPRRRGVRTAVRPGPGRLQHAQPEPRLRRSSRRSAIAWRADRPAAGAGPSRPGCPSTTSTTSGCGAGLRLGSCTFFNGPNTDHRGQLVRVLLPKEEVRNDRSHRLHRPRRDRARRRPRSGPSRASGTTPSSAATPTGSRSASRPTSRT